MGIQYSLPNAKNAPRPIYDNFRTLLCVLGYFNAFCSLLVILLHWKLKLFSKMTVIGKSIFLMTIMQFAQDISLGYLYECPLLPQNRKWSRDDDTF